MSRKAAETTRLSWIWLPLTTSLAPHYSCTSPMDCISHHALHSHIPIHHYTNHTAVTNHSIALIVSPHLHLIHTHTSKQHTSMHSTAKSCSCPGWHSERYPSCCLVSLCLTPDCLTLEPWTCDPDPCLVLFTSLPCLWYSCFCPLTIACLILPLSNKYLTAHGSTRLWPVITTSHTIGLQTSWWIKGDSLFEDYIRSQSSQFNRNGLTCF